MGLLGSIRRKVHSPLFRRMKRKRTCGETTPLKFTSTSEFTEDSSVMESVDSSHDPRRRAKLAISEDAQELLSPHNGDDTEGGGSFSFDPISDATMKDQENPKTNNEEAVNDDSDSIQHDVVMVEEEKCLMDNDEDEAMYVSEEDSDREQESVPQQHVPHVSLIRSHTPPSAMLPTHSRIRSDGHQQQLQQVMHIFHDELSTLYEEPNKSSSESSDSSVKSASSMVENRIVPVQDTLDESNIRARWEYALRLMVGNCEPSEFLYNFPTFAEMMPSSSAITNGELDMEVAEI